MQNKKTFEEMYTELLADPRWLFMKFDINNNYCDFVRVDHGAYTDSMFLDHRVSADQSAVVRFELIPLLERFFREDIPQRPVNYIFHIGHCGSTLISRILGGLDEVLALREPLPVIALSDHYRQLDKPPLYINDQQYSRLEAFVVYLVTRTFTEKQTALVKPTSYCYNIANRLMGYNSGSKSALLYISLESYLATMLRAPQRREEAVNTAGYCLTDLISITGADCHLSEAMSVEYAIALNWITQMAWLMRMNRSQALTPRIHIMDFEAFLRDPVDKLQGLCAFLGINANPSKIEEVIKGPILQSYSKKPGFYYDSSSRTDELDLSRKKFTKEIRAALAWAEELCAGQPMLEDVAGYF